MVIMVVYGNLFDMGRPAGSKNKKTIRKEKMLKKKAEFFEKEQEGQVFKRRNPFEPGYRATNRKFETPDQMKEALDEYFEDVPQKNWSITGVALHLGFASRQSFKRYADIEGFEDLVTWALLKVEHAYEMDLKHFGRPGTIFALKNMDWADKQQVESVALNLSMGGGITDGQMVKLAERYTKMYDLLKTPDGFISKEEAEQQE